MAWPELRPYRHNVGIVVFNKAGLVLAGERIHYRGVFQLPQGGVDRGEDTLAAAYRELAEETGLILTPESDPPRAEYPDYLCYDFPKDVPTYLKIYRGQKQKWYFFYWDGALTDLKLDAHEQEFVEVRWLPLAQLTADIVDFKKPVYSSLLDFCRESLPELTAP